MDLQTYLHNAVAAQRKDSFDKSDQLTLGEIISKCTAIAARQYRTYNDEEPRVRFDFEYIRPSQIYSWRGSYDELSLSFTDEGEIFLSDFIDLLESAVGKTFTGYKGGEFTMSRHTPVWVANYGNSANTAVIEVVDDDFHVILITGHREY